MSATRRLLSSSLLALFPCLLLRSVDSLAPQTNNNVNRRDVLIGASKFAGIAGITTALHIPENVFAVDATAPIAVLGASGRTGALCVASCLRHGFPVKALTRSGSWPPEKLAGGLSIVNENLLDIATCDVKDPNAISNAIKGCRAVIYAASASKQGGDAKAIDNAGVVSAARACLGANVGRYIVISSTATTRPKSLGYVFTDVFGGIMGEKRLGEIGVEELYSSHGETPSSSYTIVRPGGLEEPKKNEVLGPAELEISQGDTLAGIVSRSDLAEVCVELASSTQPNLANTAVELYYTNSAQPCEGKFKSQLKNGVRLHGSTYAELFQQIQPGIDFANI